MRPTGTGPLVPVEAQPVETIQNPRDHVGRGPLDAGVFDAEHERAAVAARVKPVEKGGAGAADVRISGRRGSKTNPRRHAPLSRRPRESLAPNPTYTLRSAFWRNR